MRFLCALAAMAALSGGAAGAQDLFSPVITVGDRAVTGFELQQRELMLRFFQTPGDLAALARTQLVEDRLKAAELERVGLQLAPETLQAELEAFAGRADLSLEEFTALLGEAGIAEETLRDYVSLNVAWRDYARARFGDTVEVSEAEVDARLERDAVGASGIEVLLSEIIIPAPPPQAAQAEATALAISRVTTEAAFEGAAREVSAVPSREQGGRLDWVPLSNYPAGLQELILSLAPGEVTPPLPLEGAVALLQLRDLREGEVPKAQPTTIDYAVVRIPGGLSGEAVAEAQGIAAAVDACDDLYGLGLPADRLLREAQPPEAIPQDVAVALAALDRNEATWGPTADGGATLLFVMLCSRDYPLPEGAEDREAVASAIRSEIVTGYAEALLADLRARAVIVGE
jgi:peptidyl-prolyl cis-trans isomerase SurA